MALEMHVYVGERMPAAGMSEFWRVQKAMEMRMAHIVTNQMRFIRKATCDAGYKVYVHEDGTTTLIDPAQVDGVGRYLRSK